MPAEKATAIVLRVIEFSESSSICTLFTREFGKVQALAKGARRPKGPFESALDLLALCRVVFLRKSSDALDLLTEAKLERRFRPAEGDLVSLYSAYYVAELLGDMADDYDPHPELFDAAAAALFALRTKGNAASSVLRFEMTALRVLGHLPALDVCAECGRSLDLSGRVPFGMLAGGAMCGKCREGKKNVVSVSGPVLRLMKQYAEDRFDDEQPTQPDRRVYGELRGVLNHYLSHLIGHAPKMHKLLGNLASA
jgi:DNA repair protein RecO (recombination protein O)